jgi:drug/metabolite transporter (DMT)-like permease
MTAARSNVPIAWIALVAVETLCQVAVKLSGRHTGPLELGWAAAGAALGGAWFWVALGCYVAGFFLWMRILSASMLSSAFPTSAIVFVAVMFASVVLLGEQVGATQIVGCVAIVSGIVLLGTDRTPATAGRGAEATPILDPSPERSLP